MQTRLLSVSTWNAQHLARSSGDVLDFQLKHEFRSDILFLQEGHYVTLEGFRDSQNSYRFLHGTAMNGVCSMVHLKWASSVTDVFSTKDWQRFYVTMHGALFLCVNLHLPCQSICDQRDITLGEIVDSIIADLEYQRSRQPWHGLILGGDLNTRFPSSSYLGESVVRASAEGRWCDRCSCLQAFFDRFQLCFAHPSDSTSDFHTHFNDSSKTSSVLDYVLFAVPGGCMAFDVLMGSAFLSDHNPLRAVLEFPVKGRGGSASLHEGLKKPKVHSKRLGVLKAEARDLFVDIMDATDFASMDLEAFGKCVRHAHETALSRHSGGPGPGSVLKRLLEEVLVTHTTAVSLAVNPESKRQASRELSKAKKKFFADRATERFLHSALAGPRDSRKEVAIRRPLLCDGLPSLDPLDWESEFRKVYSELFFSATNSVAEQQDRIAALRRSARLEARIVVPRHLLEEGLARGRGRSSSAPGFDGVCWNALVCLPGRAKHFLLKMFESRLNGDDGHLDVVSSWCRVIVRLIPKRTQPNSTGDFRPISLCSVLQKLYLFCVIKLMDAFSDQVGPQHYGFRECHQTLELFDTARNVVCSCTEWGLGGYLLKCDVQRAFDHIHHDVLDEILAEANTPSAVRASLQLEFHKVHLDLSLFEFYWPDIPFLKGGRQGGVDTPSLWIRYLDRAIKRAVAVWELEGWGVSFDLAGLPVDERVPQLSSPDGRFWIRILVWADDCLIFGSTLEHVRKMFLELTKQLRECRLSWKPASLELLRFGTPWSSDGIDSLIWKHHDLPDSFRVVCKDVITVLGLALNSTADPDVTAQHRCDQGWVHFFARQAFRDRRIPLRTRLLRLRETVLRTMLYGCGAWGFQERAVGLISTSFRKMFHLMLNVHRRFDETPAQFHCRIESTTNRLWSEWEVIPVAGQIARLNCGWLGHVARQPCDSVVWQVCFWRSAEWVLIHGRDSSIPKRLRCGRPRQAADWRLQNSFGPFWRSLAMHRQLWAAAVTNFVTPSLPCELQTDIVLSKLGLVVPLGIPKTLKPIRFLDFISRKHRDFLAGSRVTASLKLLILCHDDCVCRMIIGALKPGARLLPLIQYIRWLLYLLEQRWGCMCWPGCEGLVYGRPKQGGILHDTVLSSDECCMDEDEWAADVDLTGLREGFLIVNCEARVHRDCCGIAASVQRMQADGPDVLSVVRTGRVTADWEEGTCEAVILGLRAFVKCMFAAGLCSGGDPALAEYFVQLPLN